MKYRPRIVDSILEKKLSGTGAILIEGPKWCGKTTTAEMMASSSIYINDPKHENEYVLFSETDPSYILDGDSPRLIDEWQLIPKIWDAIRFDVDHRDGHGHFILTGSSVPADLSAVHHSGTGRIGRLLMRPMSLYESGDSNGNVSLKSLFDDPNNIKGTNDLTFERLSFLTCRGGWPQTIDMADDIALDRAFDYVDGIVKSDINRIDGVKRDEKKVMSLMRSYARNQGSQTSNSEIAKDISSSSTISDKTVGDYIRILSMMFVVEEMPSWNPNLRSKTAIRTSNTRYFIDPSIATASLGIGPGNLIKDLPTFGFMFETMAVRDLRTYAESFNATAYHYRDRRDLECDCVIVTRDGHYALIEIKLGGERLIDEGSKRLKMLCDDLDFNKMGEPSFVAVLVGVGEYAYRRSDGVLVIPIGCLKN